MKNIMQVGTPYFESKILQLLTLDKSLICLSFSFLTVLNNNNNNNNSLLFSKSKSMEIIGRIEEMIHVNGHSMMICCLDLNTLASKKKIHLFDRERVCMYKQRVQQMEREKQAPC